MTIAVQLQQVYLVCEEEEYSRLRRNKMQNKELGSIVSWEDKEQKTGFVR